MVRHLGNLTFSRYLAVLCVFASHLWNTGGLSSFGPHTQRVFSNGYIAVGFFFILSGFILMYVHHDEFRRPTWRRCLNFYFSRFVRIVPIWLFVSLPFLIVGILNRDEKMVFLYSTFLQAWSPDMSVAFGYLSVAWTLSVEMFFYALFPFIAITVCRLENLCRYWTGPLISVVSAFIPIGAATWASWSDMPFLQAHYYLYRMPLFRLADFVFGIGIYLSTRCVLMLVRPNVSGVIGALLTLGGFIISILLMRQLSLGIWTFDAAFVLPLGSIVMGLAMMDLSGSFSITWRPLLLLGEASYAFYLIHAEFGIFRYSDLQKGWQLPQGTWAIWITIMITATSIGLHLGLERPTQKALRSAARVAYRLLRGLEPSYKH